MIHIHLLKTLFQSEYLARCGQENKPASLIWMALKLINVKNFIYDNTLPCATYKICSVSVEVLKGYAWMFITSFNTLGLKMN